MKSAALSLAASVVSIVTRSGDGFLFSGSGTIIDSNPNDIGLYSSTILSSATLIVDPVTRQIAQDVTVDVFIKDGNSFRGTIRTHDLHYNILIVSILSESKLARAHVKYLEEYSLDVDIALPVLGTSATKFLMCPDATLTVVGRRVVPVAPYNKLMFAVGKFSIERCNLDCNELMRLNCKIEKGGIGGPVVIGEEVIGIAFCAPSYTPFLPINVALGWWKRHQENMGLCQLELGARIANLYTADIEVLADLYYKFQNLPKGVIVEKVKIGSLADRAGICVDDVIVECSGNTVGSLLELFEITWGHVGESFDLVVLRGKECACLKLSMVLAERAPHEIHSWPVQENISRRSL